MKRNLTLIGLCFLFIGGLAVYPRAGAADERKPSVDEIVLSHLAAIGKPEARAAIKTRLVTGQVKYIVRTGVRTGTTGDIEGKGLILSAGEKLRYQMAFGRPQYTGEDFTFDGSHTASLRQPGGARSELAIFLDLENLPLREGLLAGALSTAWPLLRYQELKPKLDYNGVKKIDGNPAYELRYRARKGSTALTVSLYFDASNFRHIRSLYKWEVGAITGSTPEQSGRQTESKYTLMEDYGDFRVVDGLTLPFRYRLQLTQDVSFSSSTRDWVFEAQQITHNKQATDEHFIVR